MISGSVIVAEPLFFAFTIYGRTGFFAFGVARHSKKDGILNNGNSFLICRILKATLGMCFSGMKHHPNTKKPYAELGERVMDAWPRISAR